MMRINKVVGISIGNYRISVSYVVKGQLKSYFYENVPDNAVKDGMIQYWDAMSEFLHDTLKQHGIKCKNVIFSVPLNGVYIRNIELPLMNLQQLELNLPFEFHDYISESSDKYFYDYAVIEKTDKSMRLQAVACSKELIERYRKMAKAAKLVPIGLVPEVIGIQRILGAYKQQFSIEEQKDFAILDMGDQSFKIHFYNKGIYNATRTFEPGGYALAEKISEINGTDIHISHLALEENLNNIQSHPSLVQMYENRAVEIMRALNFYSYSNNNNNIDTLYYCGGVSNIRKYIKVLSETVNLPVRPLGDLVAVMDDEVRDSFISCPQSHGITVDPDYEPKPLTAEEADRFRAHIEKYEQQKIDSFKDEEYRGTVEKPVSETKLDANDTDLNSLASQVSKAVEAESQAAPMPSSIPTIDRKPEPVVQPAVEAVQQPVITNAVPVMQASPEPITHPVAETVQQPQMTDSVPVIKSTPEPVTSEVVPLIIPTSEPEASEPVPVLKTTTEPEPMVQPAAEDVHDPESSNVVPVIKKTSEPVITEWAVSAPLNSQDLKQFSNNSELKPIGLEETFPTMETTSKQVQDAPPVIKAVEEPVQEKLPVIKSVEEPVVRNAPPVQEKTTVVESLIASVQDVHSIANSTTTSVQNKPPVIESVVAAVQEASVKETSPVIESVTPPVQEASPVVNAVEEKQEPPMFSRDISEDELEQQAFDLIRSLAKKSSDDPEAESSTNNDTKTEESSENDFAARLIRLNDYMDDPVKESDDQWVKHLDEDEYDTDTDRAIEELTERFLKGQTS